MLTIIIIIAVLACLLFLWALLRASSRDENRLQRMLDKHDNEELRQEVNEWAEGREADEWFEKYNVPDDYYTD